MSGSRWNGCMLLIFIAMHFFRSLWFYVSLNFIVLDEDVVVYFRISTWWNFVLLLIFINVDFKIWHFFILLRTQIHIINADAVQFFLLPVVLGSSFFALVVGNTLYAAALSWYWYVTHLGYRTLPFLSNTEVFLFPIAAIAVVYVLNLVLHPFGYSWNTSIMMARFYFGSYLVWVELLEWIWRFFGSTQNWDSPGCKCSSGTDTHF